MKLIIILAVAALSSGDKLDRTYLPPSYAQTSGGNGQILETPVRGPQNYQNNDFTQATSSSFGDAQNYPQNNEYAQNANFAQDVNGFAQDNDFHQDQDSGFDSFDRPERPQAAGDRSAEILRLDNQNDGETYAYAYETSNGISAEETGVAVDGVKAQGGYSYTGDDGQVYSIRYTADENGFVPVGDHLPTPPPVPQEILKALEQNAQDEANGIFDDGSYSEGNSDNHDDDDSVVTTNALLRSNDAQSNFAQQRSSQNVDKAYLPPFQQNAQRPQANTVASFQPRQNSAYRNQANSGNQNGIQRAYLPPRFGQNAQRTQPRFTPAQDNGFRNGNNQNAVNRAYVPPQQSALNAQRPQASARFTAAQINGFKNQPEQSSNQNGLQRAYVPPQRSNQRQVARNGNVANGVERSYLPPGQFGQRSQNIVQGRAPQANGGFRNQASNGVERTYVPPSGQNQPIRNNGPQSRRPNINREYLPPNRQY
ncbi:insect cuticle protein domain-containing protein [Phthorimaea operculella]|nr:insect cuticle protein domain-containing protein [Phthorimaea operculella]